MELEKFCKENDYSISEIDLRTRNSRGRYILYKKDVLELIPNDWKICPRNKSPSKRTIDERFILKNREKRIIFTKDYNKQCHASVLYLKGDFYLAIDGHMDVFNNDGDFIVHQDEYWCGDYRKFIIDRYLDKMDFFLIDATHNADTVLIFNKYVQKSKENEIDFGITRDTYRNLIENDFFRVKSMFGFDESGVDLIFEELKSQIKGKKGTVCLDYDILNRECIKKYNLDTSYSRLKGVISFELLKKIVKTVLDNSEVLNFIVTVPYKDKKFLEDLLD